MENLARKWPEVRMATILAADPSNTLGPIGATSKMFKAVKDSLRWTCVGLVLGKRIANYGLDYSFPMGNVSSHIYTYAEKRSFTGNLEEKSGKCGLTPPNKRFERTRGTSPFAAQPNVIRTAQVQRRDGDDMYPENNLVYPVNEIVKKSELDKHFKKWYKIAKKMKFIKNYTADDIVFDGFYPYYYNQKVKILFIGREALGMTGQNYIETIFQAYKNNSIGNKTLDSYKFHNLMFYITFGINNNYINWAKIPYASEIVENFGVFGGISFAFMNISKFSNESNAWKADWGLIDNFVDSFSNDEINLISEEIDILDPDLIITMNLEERINKLGKIEVIEYGDRLSKYYLETNIRKYLLFDTFHFSAPNKSSEKDYYKEIISECKKMGIV
ncbi:MAG: hypothetical protein RBR42_03325 [Desulfomicrobium sp.]|nr:hypothetical protein [Desulfomicrobium sp.]